MKQFCHYSIIRFMPFLETEEFANIGVLLFSPQTGYISFKLAPKRFARVTNFFDDLDGAIYQKGLEIFENELNRVTIESEYISGKYFIDYFKEVTRPREGVFRFGNLSGVMCDNPSVKLEELYNHYIGREFATKEYREQVMVRTLRAGLRKNVVEHKFTQQQLHGEFNTNISLPLVAKLNDHFKVIKPLAFDQTKPITLLEHGEKWIGRIKRLLNNDTVQPNNMLFTVEKPAKDKVDLQDAFADVEKGMRELGVRVLPFAKKHDIYEFAKCSAPNIETDFKLT